MINQLTPMEMRLFKQMAQWFQQKRGEGDRPRPFLKAEVLGSSQLFRVRMVKTSGDNGDATDMNTYIYSVYHPGESGSLIEAGIAVPYLGIDSRRHDYQTQELGEVDPARSGLAYYDMFEGERKLIIYHCNEQYRVGACEDECMDDPNCGQPGFPACTCTQIPP